MAQQQLHANNITHSMCAWRLIFFFTTQTALLCTITDLTDQTVNIVPNCFWGKTMSLIEGKYDNRKLFLGRLIIYHI